eukprot:gene24448-31840_t
MCAAGQHGGDSGGARRRLRSRAEWTDRISRASLADMAWKRGLERVSDRASYIRDGAEIYRHSFAIIRREADLARFTAAEEPVAVRIVHASGMVEVAADIAFSPGAADAARAALKAGAPIFCDANMVAMGVTRARLPAGNDVICTLTDPRVPGMAETLGNTRSAAAMDLWRDRLAGSIVAIGNAPTSLYRLLEMIDGSAGLPACVIGMPVGFVGAAESKEALMADGRVPYIVVRGRKGGSAMAAARARMMRIDPNMRPADATAITPEVTAAVRLGVFHGIGLGPGDPELVTMKAVRLIRDAPVVAYFAKKGRRGNARTIVDPWLVAGVEEMPLEYPVTTEIHFADRAYVDELAAFYEASAARIGAILTAGRDVALVCEGDPMFYGSFMHLFIRLQSQFRVTVTPGVTGMSGCWSAAGQPITWGDDILSVLPGTLPEDDLTRRLQSTDAAVIMKLGSNFAKVRRAIAAAGMTGRAVYAERGTMAGEKIRAVFLADPHSRQRETPVTGTAPMPGSGWLKIVGLGPGKPDWLTREATEALAEATDIVGYGPYVERVPARPDLVRHASDNRVEVDRARIALDLALAGRKVAVVSGGDPGIFAMAAAVFEAIETGDPRWRGLALEVLPGISAMQGASARLGAVLGHDFCVISLSDNLKPWDAIATRLEAAVAGDFVLALYNPASKARPERIFDAFALLRARRAPETVVIFARAVGRADERIEVTTLAAADPGSVDIRG